MVAYKKRKCDLVTAPDITVVCGKRNTLRNDNGSQFIGGALRKYLKKKEVVQEFIHPSTPQENSFIEAYLSSIERELL